jgi:protein ImuB
MKLLLSVHLPLLPLEALRPRWSEPGVFAVVDQGLVLALSRQAALAGIRPGMRSGGVATIAPQAVLLERAVERERQALDAVATTLMQYSPDVTHLDDFSVLLDVSASLTLFGGAHALCLRVMRSVAALGFSLQLGAAPTAGAAWLLARNGRDRSRNMKSVPLRRRVLSPASMTRRLDILPCHLVSASQV